jgi:beta-lactamase regulating signal transducer with metallopeptidase domain
MLDLPGDLLKSFLLSGLEMNLAGGAAIAFMLLVRKQAHQLIGARAVYLMWAIVPAAMAATFLPPRTIEADPLLYDRIVVSVPAIHEGIDWAEIGLGLIALAWVVGGIVLAGALVKKQRIFDREADKGLAGPAVVGFHFPRIVTPDDFVKRFSHDERKLILTHEQIHIERGDSRINAAVALVRCLCWFNPLVHLGALALSADQELSCDAAVVARRPRTRRIYAEVLIKTQISQSQLMGALPVGCYWPAHPLKERIAALAMKPLPKGRHVMASFAVVGLAMGGGVAAWAAQPERLVPGETIEIFLPFHPVDEDPAQPKVYRIDTEPAPINAGPARAELPAL